MTDRPLPDEPRSIWNVSPLHRDLSLSVTAALARANMTQAALAASLGLSEKHVSQVLTGRASGSFDVWQGFARSLGKRWEVRLV